VKEDGVERAGSTRAGCAPWWAKGRSGRCRWPCRSSGTKDHGVDDHKEMTTGVGFVEPWPGTVRRGKGRDHLVSRAAAMQSGHCHRREPPSCSRCRSGGRKWAQTTDATHRGGCAGGPTSSHAGQDQLAPAGHLLRIVGPIAGDPITRGPSGPGSRPPRRDPALGHPVPHEVGHQECRHQLVGSRSPLDGQPGQQFLRLRSGGCAGAPRARESRCGRRRGRVPSPLRASLRPALPRRARRSGRTPPHHGADEFLTAAREYRTRGTTLPPPCCVSTVVLASPQRATQS